MTVLLSLKANHLLGIILDQKIHFLEFRSFFTIARRHDFWKVSE